MRPTKKTMEQRGQTHRFKCATPCDGCDVCVVEIRSKAGIDTGANGVNFPSDGPWCCGTKKFIQIAGYHFYFGRATEVNPIDQLDGRVRKYAFNKKPRRNKRM